MAFEEKRIPYELLVRYGLNGKPSGAHVAYQDVLLVDGNVRSQILGEAQPVDLAGFPASEIMSDTTRDALAVVSTLTAQVATLTEAAEAHTAYANALEVENEALIEQVAHLEEALAAIDAAPAVSAEAANELDT